MTVPKILEVPSLVVSRRSLYTPVARSPTRRAARHGMADQGLYLLTIRCRSDVVSVAVEASRALKWRVFGMDGQ